MAGGTINEMMRTRTAPDASSGVRELAKPLGAFERPRQKATAAVTATQDKRDAQARLVAAVNNAGEGAASSRAIAVLYAPTRAVPRDHDLRRARIRVTW